jgi:VWFA-related protein
MMRTGSRMRLVFLSAVLSVAVFPALQHAQQAPPPQTQQQPPPQPQRPTFRTGIDAVTVDVIATDKDGKPVTDLTAADFEIKEAGKVQTIETFKRISLEEDKFDVDPVRATPILSMETMQREAARDDVRLITIFLDDYHTRLGNSMAIREKLASFVSQLDPRDMVAVMYPLTPTMALTFSRDHAGTANTIMKFEGRKYNYLERYPQEQIYHRLSRPQIEDLRNQIVIEAMEGLCVFLGSMREGRKTVLMVSEGMASTLPVQLATQGRLGGGGISDPDTDINRERGQFFNQLGLLERMKRIFEAATRSNTSVYTLDPRGLATQEFDLSEPTVDSATDRRVMNEAMDNLRTIADQTDGRAIVNRNDPRSELRQMIRDSSAYYLLGYNSTEAPRDGKFHEIKVRSKRKGVELRARKGYWAYTMEDVERASAPAKPSLPPDIVDALASVAAPARGHAVRTWLGFDKGTAEDGKTNVTLVWEVAPNVAADDVPHQVGVLANFVTGDLLFRGKVPRDPNSLTPSGRITFASKPGAMHLRLSAEGAAGQLIDSEERDVLVPDFAKAGPVVTPPEVFRARTARELQQIRQLSTALPSTVQEFSRSEQLLLRFRAYGPAGIAPALTVRLRNSIGEVMFTFPAPERRADGVYELPYSLGGLASGSYIIEIEAASDSEKSRVLWGFKITS